jgi:hypothetical protein
VLWSVTYSLCRFIINFKLKTIAMPINYLLFETLVSKDDVLLLCTEAKGKEQKTKRKDTGNLCLMLRLASYMEIR